MDKAKLAEARTLTEDALSNPNNTNAVGAIGSAVLLLLAALGADEPTSADLGAELNGNADAEGGGGTVIEAVPGVTPPPLLSSIPPGLYEAPRDGSASQYASASTMYEKRREPPPDEPPSSPTEQI